MTFKSQKREKNAFLFCKINEKMQKEKYRVVKPDIDFV